VASREALAEAAGHADQQHPAVHQAATDKASTTGAGLPQPHDFLADLSPAECRWAVYSLAYEGTDGAQQTKRVLVH
jgi:hypothetical protein